MFWFGAALIVSSLFAGATIIDTLVKGGDLGTGLTAGAFAFGASLFASMSAHVLSIAFEGVSAVQTLQFAYGGFGLYQTFKEGNIATGVLSAYLPVFGPPGDEATHSTGEQTGSGVARSGQPPENGAIESVERPAKTVAETPAKTTVSVRYKALGKIGGKTDHHAFVEVSGPNGERYVIRAGPSASSGSPKLAVLTDVSRLPPVVDEYGNLVVHDGDIAAAVEARSRTVASQIVLATSDSFTSIVPRLATFGARVNQARIRYGPISANSNAFAHQAVTALRVPRPRALVWPPGSNATLRF